MILSPRRLLFAATLASVVAVVIWAATPASPVAPATPPAPVTPPPTIASLPAQPLQQAVVVPPKEDMALALDATAKEYVAKPGEESCVFLFSVKNVSNAEVTINQVRTSCGCTVAKLPSQPWKLAPGESGNIQLTVDVRGKSGVLEKTATIDTPTGFKELTLTIKLPGSEGAVVGAQDRTKNMQTATADRQAVFQGDCAKCHAAPTKGQMGEALYVSACSICHDAAHRASMVPDLHTLNHPTDRAFWLAQISSGRPGTLMPAFAENQGGPLKPEQIDSLAEYLAKTFSPKHPK